MASYRLRPALWKGLCYLLRWISRQRLSHIRLGYPELSGNSRWRDASLEGGANCVHLPTRQRDFGDVHFSSFVGRTRPFRRQLRWTKSRWRHISPTLCGNLPRRFASSNAASKSYGYEWTDYAQDTRPVQHRGRVALPDVPALTENVEGPGDEQAGGNLLREALSPPPDPKMIRSRARTGTAEVPLFPMSHLPVFSLLFAFGEII
jgi:hypothetical protein